jgi:4-hydroxyphenylpyruvate dioxygenase
VHRQPVGPGELDIPSIRGVGGALMYFLDRGADLGRVWDVEFAPVDDATEPTGLARVDHIAQSIPFEELPTWRLYYRTIFDLEPTQQVDVVDPAGLVESQVLQSPDRSVRFTLNASQSRQTQAGRFIDELFGAGVQHVAFACDDIFIAVERIRSAGVDLLPIPENYYDDLESRFELEAETMDRLRSLDILYDEDERGRYFQVYTRVFAERFFFEVVQRVDYDGFGAPNAPIRLAAQTRLARGPAMPRE